MLSAFSTSAAITTIVSQLKSLFGLSYPSSRLSESLINFVNHITEIRLADTLLGVVCLAFLLPLQSLKEHRFLKHKSKKSVALRSH